MLHKICISSLLVCSLISAAAGAATKADIDKVRLESIFSQASTPINFGKGIAADGSTLYVNSTSHYVGIGTSSPAGKLDVIGSIFASGGEALKDDGSSVYVGNISTSSGTHSRGLILKSGGTDRVVIPATGGVGIGTATPSVALDVVGGAKVSGALTAGSAGITGNLVVDTDVLYADAANNTVGIGTTSPTAKLDVVGTAKVSGATNLSDTITGVTVAKWNTLSQMADNTTNPGLISTGAQTIGGVKTFTSTIVADISGNASTASNADRVTNGVYDNSDQTLGGNYTFTNLITGNISGSAAYATNAGTVTNGVTTIGDQSIAGKKTFTGYVKASNPKSKWYSTSAVTVPTCCVAGTPHIIGSTTGTKISDYPAGSLGVDGTYTCPVQGLYRVTAGIQTDYGTNNPLVYTLVLSFYRGTTIESSVVLSSPGVAGIKPGISGSATIDCGALEKIKVTFTQTNTGGGASSLTGIGDSSIKPNFIEIIYQP